MKKEEIVLWIKTTLISMITVFTLLFLCGYLKQREDNARAAAEKSSQARIANKDWHGLKQRSVLMTGIPVNDEKDGN